MSALYLYALASDCDDGEGLRGITGEEVVFLRAHGLVAAVGALEAVPAPGAESLRGHDAVVRALDERADALLPMRFGQSVADEAALGERLERALPRLREALELVRGCEEIDLRVFGGRPAPAEFGPAPGAGPGARYLARRLELARAQRLPQELAPVRERLAPLVRAELARTFAEGRLVATLYQLVRRADRAEYFARLEQARRGLADLRLSVRGPFPAYAFADGGTAPERPR